jgi:hypothetical protein
VCVGQKRLQLAVCVGRNRGEIKISTKQTKTSPEKLCQPAQETRRRAESKSSRWRPNNKANRRNSITDVKGLEVIWCT